MGFLILPMLLFRPGYVFKKDDFLQYSVVNNSDGTQIQQG